MSKFYLQINLSENTLSLWKFLDIFNYKYTCTTNNCSGVNTGYFWSKKLEYFGICYWQGLKFNSITKIWFLWTIYLFNSCSITKLVSDFTLQNKVIAKLKLCSINEMSFFSNMLINLNSSVDQMFKVNFLSFK